MKILAIGNSFSEDATRYLQAIDKTLFVRNLYIGGCSLSMHYENATNDNKAYAYEENAQPIDAELVSIKDSLTREKWDIVTLQQVSGLSGQIESYEPYLTELIKYVKNYCPSAEIYFQQTWAYDSGSNHPDFIRYDKDSDKMFKCIKSASQMVEKTHGLKLIKTGEFINRLRNTDIFKDVPLYRDLFHLSLTEGRYSAALCWDYFLTGKISKVIPGEINKPVAEKIIKELEKFVSEK